MYDVCMCVYVSVHACMYVCMFVCIYVCMYVHMHAEVTGRCQLSCWCITLHLISLLNLDGTWWPCAGTNDTPVSNLTTRESPEHVWPWLAFYVGAGTLSTGFHA